jgi:hypothetical protein
MRIGEIDLDGRKDGSVIIDDDVRAAIEKTTRLTKQIRLYEKKKLDGKLRIEDLEKWEKLKVVRDRSTAKGMLEHRAMLVGVQRDEREERYRKQRFIARMSGVRRYRLGQDKT